MGQRYNKQSNTAAVVATALLCTTTCDIIISGDKAPIEGNQNGWQNSIGHHRQSDAVTSPRINYGATSA